MDASSAPAERAGTETSGSSQGGTTDASSAAVGRTENDTKCSSQGGTVDASSVPGGRAESDLSAVSTAGTDQWNGEDPPAVLLGRAAHELSDWGRPPVSAGPDPGSRDNA